MRASSARRSAIVFSALGDETRLRLIARLAGGGPMSITGLTAGSKVSRQAITKHLHVMQTAGLVQGARCGRESLWQLDPKRVDEARQYLDVIGRQWDEALARLRTFVEQ